MAPSQSNNQYAFISWLKSNEDRFAIPLILGKQSDQILEIGFKEITPVISAILIRDEITVAVEWNEECWDLLASFESAPIKRKNAYICQMCSHRVRQLFPSREELWSNHLYVPFLEWVNTRLQPSNWLAICQLDGMTSSYLSVEQPSCEGLIATLSVHT